MARRKDAREEMGLNVQLVNVRYQSFLESLLERRWNDGMDDAGSNSRTAVARWWMKQGMKDEELCTTRKFTRVPSRLLVCLLVCCSSFLACCCRSRCRVLALDRSLFCSLGLSLGL